MSCAASLIFHARGSAADTQLFPSSFTFDSCYSYLSYPALDAFDTDGKPSEPPLPRDVLDPLVDQAVSDYACATLLLRLPGVIPLPAFDVDVPMPSGLWVSQDRTSFVPEVERILSRPPSEIPTVKDGSKKVVDVPLIVRPPSPQANTPEFRRDLLASMGVPPELLESRVVLVSFGGQAIPRPRSRPPSPLSSPIMQRSASAVSTASLEPPRDATREAGLLPKGWIAIVTGLSGGNNAIREDLPYGFFASEKDVYVPDLTWVADCVLGKLVSSDSRMLQVPSRLPVLMTPPPPGMSTRVTALVRKHCRARRHSSTVSSPFLFLQRRCTAHISGTIDANLKSLDRSLSKSLA